MHLEDAVLMQILFAKFLTSWKRIWWYVLRPILHFACTASWSSPSWWIQWIDML